MWLYFVCAEVIKHTKRKQGLITACHLSDNNLIVDQGNKTSQERILISWLLMLLKKSVSSISRENANQSIISRAIS
jgi:hypothetical protein